MARFIFCVHNHQPVDNFDHVLKGACEDAYEPFLEVMERHSSIKFCAHYSGCLLEWIERNRPGFFARLRNLVEQGRLELLGGGFYEPIFSMLPEDDVLGQIRLMNAYLKKHFGKKPQGLWLPERVWEPHFPELLARSGLRYGVLDDFHFRTAGLRGETLYGHYVTEDRGSLFSLFPISERLRYAIPFEEPLETLEHLARFPEDAVVVFADDGEKFGSWPGTKESVYGEGWMERFLRAIEGIRTVTFSEVLEEPPRGRVYLPACSYREMGEWSLFPECRKEFDALREALKEEGRWESALAFLPGGLWRNFRARYPEANMMYARMLEVSRRVRKAGNENASVELYRAQCNCVYWHGFFGGLYLPHLRQSVYRHLMAAEDELGDRTFGIGGVDLDLDGREELRLSNRGLDLFISPALGAQILELDVRKRRVNLGAMLARRPEPYHASQEHEFVYDPHLRTSLVDHFFPPGVEHPECGEDIGDFVTGAYTSEAVTSGRNLVATFEREGLVGGVPVHVLKKLVMPAEKNGFGVTYTIRAKEPLKAVFAVEYNLQISPPKVTPARLSRPVLKLKDEWNGLSVEFEVSSAGGYRVYPVETVSQYEGGFERNHQGTAVVPWWEFSLEPGHPWSVAITFRVLVPRGAQ